MAIPPTSILGIISWWELSVQSYFSRLSSLSTRRYRTGVCPLVLYPSVPPSCSWVDMDSDLSRHGGSVAYSDMTSFMLSKKHSISETINKRLGRGRHAEGEARAAWGRGIEQCRTARYTYWLRFDQGECCRFDEAGDERLQQQS